MIPPGGRNGTLRWDARLRLRGRAARLCTGTGVAAAMAACSDFGPLASGPAPVIEQLKVQANSLNTLSAVVTFESRRADSVQVLYWVAGEPAAATPAAPV